MTIKTIKCEGYRDEMDIKIENDGACGTGLNLSQGDDMIYIPDAETLREFISAIRELGWNV